MNLSRRNGNLRVLADTAPLNRGTVATTVVSTGIRSFRRPSSEKDSCAERGSRPSRRPWPDLGAAERVACVGLKARRDPDAIDPIRSGLSGGLWASQVPGADVGDLDNRPGEATMRVHPTFQRVRPRQPEWRNWQTR